MLKSRSGRRLCHSCSLRLFSLFRYGFGTLAKQHKPVHEAWKSANPRTRQVRQFANCKAQRHSEIPAGDENSHPKTLAQIEAIVHQTRRTFGETLPTNFLSPEEYKLYERLCGEPLETTRPEDTEQLQVRSYQSLEEAIPQQNSLFIEDAEGNLEEADYLQEHAGESEPSDKVEQEATGQHEDGIEVAEQEKAPDLEANPREEQSDEFKSRLALFRDISAANQARSTEVAEAHSNAADSFFEQHTVGNPIEEASEPVYAEDTIHDDREAEEQEEEEDDLADSDSIRTHPLTAAARSGTFPSTLQIPKVQIVEPVMQILRDASNKHLSEIALKTFGGAGLPNSTATPSTAGGHLRQAPIALEASQKYMGEIEGNVYLAAIMPGAYATIMSTLVEVRRRVGSEWLRGLLRKEGGPRILDAGAAGAGVQAWREILRAEWKSMHPEGVPDDAPTPLGKATVVTGSDVLRHKASRLLENTTFLPRLPDYNPERDHPTRGVPNVVQPRKQYDIVVAPHTLWGLQEDYMRKNQIQNFWSLLNPIGGILIIIEKGVPRGFELVAGARELILSHHIASPDLSADTSQPIDEQDSRYGPKEKGMIIAPCTNHARCPMYTIPGKSTGRKDLCHFSQRFIRPPYLQRILGFNDQNHEDIKFSYIAVQRGVDHRGSQGILQGAEATAAALTGYESAGQPDKEAQEVGLSSSAQASLPHMLSLPRIMLPPIKRRGHVILDLCTPAGRIERWTVPKSFSKQAYRDARKSSWGDLWALGAKTAIPRNIRLGTRGKKARGSNIFVIKTGRDGPDDMTHASGHKAKFEKRTKKGRVQIQRKKVIKDGF